MGFSVSLGEGGDEAGEEGPCLPCWPNEHQIQCSFCLALKTLQHQGSLV